MTNLWHDIERGTLDKLNVIIEVPKLSRVKYELDKDSGLIKFDRVLYSPMHYPENYGFIPKSLWEDGDPMDVLVMTHEPLVPGCLIQCRVVGILDMIDSGEGDSKVLAVPIKDPRFENVKELSDVNEHLLKEVKHFFTVYKDLQNKKVEVGDWKGAQEATEAIKKSFDLYDQKYSN